MTVLAGHREWQGECRRLLQRQRASRARVSREKDFALADSAAQGCGRLNLLTSSRLPARFAVPDARRLPLDAVFATEDAGVRRVLRHLHLLDLLSQAGTIPSAVLTHDPHLLGALAHPSNGLSSFTC